MAVQQEFVEQLFEAALALEPSVRAAFLDQACGEDHQLKRVVEDLLAEDAQAGSMLEHSPVESIVRSPVSPASGANTTGSIGDQIAPILAGSLKPGQNLIGRFIIVRYIAKGGMGEVYEAEDRLLQCARIALKTILPEVAGEPAFRERFEREVLLAREVGHPNLCPVHDIFHSEQPDLLFLTMKLLAGETLSARLRASPAISQGEAMAILRQMAAGLRAIHDAGIVHRDIKPNNIMLEGSGPEVRLSITDFGLARARHTEQSLFGKGLVAGTPDYMAPELFAGGEPSQASDLFALPARNPCELPAILEPFAVRDCKAQGFPLSVCSWSPDALIRTRCDAARSLSARLLHSILTTTREDSGLDAALWPLPFLALVLQLGRFGGNGMTLRNCGVPCPQSASSLC
jgi:hypothetical protein